MIEVFPFWFLSSHPNVWKKDVTLVTKALLSAMLIANMIALYLFYFYTMNVCLQSS